MTAEKSDAIVLRVTEFSETSCVATLFTREFGKITGLAKGARRRKSAFESALDVLSVVRLVFLRKNTGGLDLLTEARLERRFRSGSTDLGRFYAALYLAELLSVFTEEHDPHIGLFDLAQRSLTVLDQPGTATGLELLKFEFGLLSEAGHEPMLSGCSGCDRPLEIGVRNHFGLITGGLLCASCRSGQKQVVQISAETVELARKLQDSTEEIPTGVEQKTYAQLRGTISQFESAVLGFRPRTQTWLKLVPHQSTGSGEG